MSRFCAGIRQLHTRLTQRQITLIRRATYRGTSLNLAPDLFQSGVGAPDMLLVSRLLR